MNRAKITTIVTMIGFMSLFTHDPNENYLKPKVARNRLNSCGMGDGEKR